MIHDHTTLLAKGIADIRASLVVLEGAMRSLRLTAEPDEIWSGPKEFRSRAGSIANMVAKLIETSDGVTSKELIEALRPFTCAPTASVRRTITRLCNANRIKRVGGRWLPIEAPGDPDIIPQQRRR